MYRLGIYNDAISNLNQVSKNYPNDEKYFTLALYNKRNGTTKMMVSLLDDLIANYPNSEYAKLAKLQLNRLR